jgi:hypothetical protein
VKDGSNPNPSHPAFDPLSVHHIRKCKLPRGMVIKHTKSVLPAVLTPYLPRAKVRKEKNLLSGNDEPINNVEEEVGWKISTRY